MLLFIYFRNKFGSEDSGKYAQDIIYERNSTNSDGDSHSTPVPPRGPEPIVGVLCSDEV